LHFQKQTVFAARSEYIKAQQAIKELPEAEKKAKKE
jgi:hypothetical protein